MGPGEMCVARTAVPGGRHTSHPGPFHYRFHVPKISEIVEA